MKPNFQELAIFLSGQYMGVPVSQEALTKIQSFAYDHESTRFEILTNIDSALKTYQDLKPIGVVAAIEILPLDNNQFGVKFVSDVALKNATNPNQSKAENVKAILNLFSSPELNDIEMDEDDETQEAFNELEIIKSAVELIASIERHQNQLEVSMLPNPGSKSALLKYITAIEKNYLAPYLK